MSGPLIQFSVYISEYGGLGIHYKQIKQFIFNYCIVVKEISLEVSLSGMFKLIELKS